jgi:hypothetical protein
MESVIPLLEVSVSQKDIPDIKEVLSNVQTEMRRTIEYLQGMQEFAISLEQIIRDSHFAEVMAHHEATALKQSAYNCELAISDFEERMTSLQVVLSRKAIVPAILSTADDISVAFHIAV